MPKPLPAPAVPGGPHAGGALLLAAALLAVPALPAAAQAPRQAPARPAPAAAPAANPSPATAPTPERTASSYGDWVVRCENRPAEGAAPAARLCEMAQGVQNPQGQSVAQIALGRLARERALRLVVAVPPNVFLPAGARLVPEEGEPVPLAFRSCTPGACALEAEATEALLRRLRAAEGTAGRVEYRLSNEAEMRLPVSFRGFVAAFEALQREPG